MIQSVMDTDKLTIYLRSHHNHRNLHQRWLHYLQYLRIVRTFVFFYLHPRLSFLLRQFSPSFQELLDFCFQMHAVDWIKYNLIFHKLFLKLSSAKSITRKAFTRLMTDLSLHFILELLGFKSISHIART
jgi:hypothetical protein